MAGIEAARGLDDVGDAGQRGVGGQLAVIEDAVEGRDQGQTIRVRVDAGALMARTQDFAQV
ncbi:hypothetical protein D3C86_2241740 [compost metagenome]